MYTNIINEIENLINLVYDDMDLSASLKKLLKLLNGLTKGEIKLVRDYLLRFGSEEVVNDKWNDCTNFEESIQNSAKRIYIAILNQIMRNKEKGMDKEVVKERVITSFLNSKEYSLRRIAYTEETRIENEMGALEAEESGFTHYQYLTMGDDSVCGACEMIDGEVFNIADRQIGVNFPPLHSNCRCTVEFF